jgi:hypothetical protein
MTVQLEHCLEAQLCAHSDTLLLVQVSERARDTARTQQQMYL